MSVDAAQAFFAAHPELRERMAGSEVFRRIKRSALVEIDGEELYVVRGDTLGSEEELFVEAVIRGAAGQGDANRELVAELEPGERARILRAFTK